MLREEVTVNYFYQAVQLLNCQPAHRNVQDEFGKKFATCKDTSENILNIIHDHISHKIKNMEKNDSPYYKLSPTVQPHENTYF